MLLGPRKLMIIIIVIIIITIVMIIITIIITTMFMLGARQTACLLVTYVPLVVLVFRGERCELFLLCSFLT